MTVAAIEVTTPGNTQELQDWLDDHPTAVVQDVIFNGNFCYIFYV